MHIIAGLLIAVIGLVICFRGIYLAKVFKAVIGAIQGAIYALVVQAILALFGVSATGLFYFLLVFVALLMAYIAAMREELYRKIQGFINALLMGLALGAAAFVLIGVRSMSSSASSESLTVLLIIVELAILITFILLGVRAYRFFCNFGKLVLAAVFFMLMLAMYMPLSYAIIFAIVLDSLAAYLMNRWRKYIDCLKISAIGAIICAIGVVDILGKSYILSAVSSHMLNLRYLAQSSGSFYYSTEITFFVLGICALSVVGMFSQYRFLLAHTDANGKVVWNLSGASDAFKKGVGEAVHSVGKAAEGVESTVGDLAEKSRAALQAKKAAIIKGMKILLVVVAVGAAVTGSIVGIRSLVGHIEQRGGEKLVSSAASRYVESINDLYGRKVAKLTETGYGEGGDASNAYYSASVSGDFSGIIMASGIGDPDSDEFYTDYVSVEVGADDNTTEATAKLFAAVVASIFDEDMAECEEWILTAMNYGNYDPDSYSGESLCLGDSGNVDVWLSMSRDWEDESRLTWYMNCIYGF